VRSITGAGTCNTISDLKTIDAFADLDDGSGGAVTERYRRIKLCFNGGKCARETFALNFVDNFFYEVGTLTCFSEQRFFTEINLRLFRSGADERGRGSLTVAERRRP
jgi:hypothetical protein